MGKMLSILVVFALIIGILSESVSKNWPCFDEELSCMKRAHDFNCYGQERKNGSEDLVRLSNND